MLGPGFLLKQRYRIDRMLEIGALGGTYRAWDTEAGLSVVVREMLPQPDLTDVEARRLQQQFEAQGRQLLRLHHPNIVRMLDSFCEIPEDDQPGNVPITVPNAYLVMEYVEGERLIDRIAHEGPQGEDRVRQWAGELLEALSVCHRQGVLHRDIRPHNILLRVDGTAMLTGFGLGALWHTNDPRVWTAIQVMGAPEYAPPERWRSQVSQIDTRSDIYSLGATLYYALIGTPPLTAAERTANPYRFAQLKGLRSRASPKFRGVILRAMELPRDKRYRDAEAMLAALRDPTTVTDYEVEPAPLLLERHRAPLTLGRALGLLISVLVIFAAGLLGMSLQGRLTVGSPSLTATTSLPAVEQTGDGTAVVTETPAPTPTATPTLAPTVVVAPDLPAGWVSIMEDVFEDNANGWLTTDYTDDWGSVSRVVGDGEFRWEIDALQSVGRLGIPEMGDYDDLYLSVEARRISGPENTAYGLIFQLADGNYHVFSIRDDGYYQFNTWAAFEWNPTIDWTATTLVRPGEANRLTVIGEEGRYTLYINDRLVATAENDQLGAGKAGLSVFVTEAGSRAVVVFYRFELGAPGLALPPDGARSRPHGGSGVGFPLEAKEIRL